MNKGCFYCKNAGSFFKGFDLYWGCKKELVPATEVKRGDFEQEVEERLRALFLKDCPCYEEDV